MEAKTVSVAIPKTLMEQINKIRGQRIIEGSGSVSRSAVIVELIERGLKARE